MKEFKGKNCFITGAARGIGRAFALALGKLGMNVYITDIRTEELEKVRKEVEMLGVRAYASKCDVSLFEDFEKVAEEYEKTLGDIDLVINNAGIGHGDSVENINLAVWKKVIDTNLWSVIYSTKIFLPKMLAKKSGHIVSVASQGGILGLPGQPSYITSKFAVVGLSEFMYGRFRNLGINVSVITPTIVATPIWKIDTSKMKYNPKMLKDFGKEKLDEVYSTMFDEVLERGFSPEEAVEKYIEGIKQDKLYIVDNEELYQFLALKGTDPRKFEDFLVRRHIESFQGGKAHFLKHGIKLEDYR
ncbi:MAG: SDR family NAD(P)-dependent oxidoreductase [Promethearchaeota archaeon]|jgi:NAD(P)-dependent dehydrogenase (short-subunit alcohol dehydrogenase family)